MPTIDWNTFLAALGYAALTGIFNLIFARKSQIEAWAESRPRLAALLKLTRSLGFDPWNALSALSLFFAKKLPQVQKSDSVIAQVEQQKASAKAQADAGDIPVRFGPLLVLLFLGFAVSQQACSTSGWQAQRDASNVVAEAANKTVEPALIAAYRATGLVVVRAQPTQELGQLALNLHMERWKPVWAAWEGFKFAHEAWQKQIEAEGNPLPAALAARESYCKLKVAAGEWAVKLPDLPLGACQ